MPIHSASMAHTHLDSMSDHMTSCQPQSIMWLTHPTRTLITPCSQNKLSSCKLSRLSPAHRAHHTDCDVLQQLQDSAPKDNFPGKQPGKPGQNISQLPETPEPISPDTLSLSPASPLLSFSQKMEELVYAGSKLSHSIAASPQISTKKWRPPQPPNTAGPALPLLL